MPVRVRGLVLAAVVAACGRLAQSPECVKYVDCAYALDPSTSRQVNGMYGRTGTCWGTNDGTASACTVVCARELDGLRADGGMDLPECQ